MPANHCTPALYTAAEAADILKVKKSWLERQAAARRIPFTMLGGAYRFTDGHLTAIVQTYETLPSPSDKVRDNRSRPHKTHKPAQAANSAVAPLRARPRSNNRPSTGITGPSAA